MVYKKITKRGFLQKRSPFYLDEIPPKKGYILIRYNSPYDSNIRNAFLEYFQRSAGDFYYYSTDGHWIILRTLLDDPFANKPYLFTLQESKHKINQIKNYEIGIS